MQAQPQVAAKTERLLNLVICLLYTRRPLSKEQIRRAVAAYDATTSDEAFDRMFERDKEEIRRIGIPLVTEQLDALFDDEPGYRIDRRDYALPEITFEPDELAVIALASRTWAQASLAGPAALALRKLAAAGVERDDESLIGIEPRVRTIEPAFEGVKRAVVEGYPMSFTYRTASGGAPAVRHVQPWGMAAWHGRWYVTGHDIDRNDARVFRLSRIEGTISKAGKPGSYAVPPDHEPRALIRVQAPDLPTVQATLRIRQGKGHVLRRRGKPVDTPGLGTPEGWDVIQLPVREHGAFAEELAGYGADVVVIAPTELRTALIDRLTRVLEVHDG